MEGKYVIFKRGKSRRLEKRIWSNKTNASKWDGFENKYYDKTEKEFKEQVIPELIEHSKGIGLPKVYVPDILLFFMGWWQNCWFI